MGTQIFLGNPPVNVKQWIKNQRLKEPLCFTAQEAGSTVQLTSQNNYPDVSLQTSTDGNTWTTYTVNDTITLANVGDKVYFKANWQNQVMAVEGRYGQYYYNNFVMSGKIAASGNVNSLLEENEETARTMNLADRNFCYAYLFSGCTSLTTAPELPATTLADKCYTNMFVGCTSLTSAPELPATTLANGCYAEMFSGCTSLTTAPELPATELADGCYQFMFSSCTSLTSAPELPATTLANYCYESMFYNTALTTAPELPATTLANGCYSNMFYGCTSLTTPPELPATTLAGYCYSNMFYGCTSLTSAPELPATTLAESCYEYMFYGCSNLNTITLGYTGRFDATYSAFYEWVSGVASTGTFYYNGSDTTRGTSAIPTGWTVTPFTA